MNGDERSDGLTPDELDRYSWQRSVAGLGGAGQRRLKAAAVLVSRVGGVGGAAATYLAAAGVGRLVLAHAGNLRRNDLNRQTLMSTPGIGRPRVEQAAERLRALNPHVVVETVPENVTADNAVRLVARCDLVVSAAPLFAERLLLNAAAVPQGRPLVDSVQTMRASGCSSSSRSSMPRWRASTLASPITMGTLPRSVAATLPSDSRACTNGSSVTGASASNTSTSAPSRASSMPQTRVARRPGSSSTRTPRSAAVAPIPRSLGRSLTRVDQRCRAAPRCR